MQAWQTRWTADGSPTLERPSDGMRMHSAAGAWTQALLRYGAGVILPEASRLDRPFRLLDIGCGSGLNLAAALLTLEGRAVALEAVSLELDPTGTESALHWVELAAPGVPGPGHGPSLGPALPDWRPWHRAVGVALGQELQRRRAPAAPGPPGADLGGSRLPSPGNGSLRLIVGDARDTLPRLPKGPYFDGVFLDPFARAQEPDLWGPEFAAEIALRMLPGARLATYSSSLSVRESLALAGLQVGRGPRVGGKAQGTLACRGAAAQPWRPLEPRIEGKLARRLQRKITPEES